MFRKIFSLSAMILLADLFSPIANAQGLYTAPFGIQAYTFRRSFSANPGAVLDTIKQMGFTEIEGEGGKLAPEEFRKMCSDRGITIPSTGIGYDELIKDPKAVADKAKAMGATFVMCAWIPHNGDFTFENAKKAVVDFNTAGKVLHDNGITFCYHVHGFEFQPHDKGTLLDYIIHNTNPEYVSFEMDIFWIQFGGGDPVALMKKYGDRWKLMHVKDLRKGIKKDLTGGTSTDNDVALGTGEIDIAGIIREANRIGIKHFFIEDESDRIQTQVPQSVAYLRSLKK